jgi:hypothetical protein
MMAITAQVIKFLPQRKPMGLQFTNAVGVQFTVALQPIHDGVAVNSLSKERINENRICRNA